MVSTLAEQSLDESLSADESFEDNTPQSFPESSVSVVGVELTETGHRWYRVKEIAKRLEISQQMAYKLVRDGVIESIRIGRSYRVEPRALREYLTRVSIPRSAMPNNPYKQIPIQFVSPDEKYANE